MVAAAQAVLEKNGLNTKDIFFDKFTDESNKKVNIIDISLF